MTTRIDGDRAPGSICGTCNKTWSWHMNNQTQHPFNDGSISGAETFGKRLPDGSRATPGKHRIETSMNASEASAWPFDPVLRQALVNKGVITPQDLKDAEDQIRAVTNTFMAAEGAPAS